MTLATLLRPVLDARFRANPSYQLILFDRLSSSQREQLRSIVDEQEFYGVLLSKHDEGKDAKVVDQETALLYLTLQEPGPIPAYVRRKFGSTCNQAIAELVLDNILEISFEEADDFVSGGSAHDLLFQPNEKSSRSDNHLVQLSLDALIYAQHLAVATTSELAIRLYRYNTLPYSPAWRQSWENGQSVARWLGILPRGLRQSTLEKYWQEVSAPDDGWLSWYKKSWPNSVDNRKHLPFKLYISPLPDLLPELWPLILEQLTRTDVPAFKIGKSAQMILRPDKLVAYLPNFTALATTANELQKVLQDRPAQGVPFTAPIDAFGLLSWGMDPRKQVASNGSHIPESWRSWITNRLAAAVLEAKSSTLDIEPLEYVLDRIRLLGVDTETWALKQSIWQDAGRSYEDYH